MAEKETDTDTTVSTEPGTSSVCNETVSPAVSALRLHLEKWYKNRALARPSTDMHFSTAREDGEDGDV